MDKYLPINLPSKCLIYKNVKPSDVKIRAYQGRDEVFLAEINPINLEQKFLLVLKNVMTGIDPEILTLGDRLYLILWECINSYTSVIKVKNLCSHCLREVTSSVDLRSIEKIMLPDDFKQPYEVTLSEGKKVFLRLLNIKDEIEIQNFEKENDSSLLYRYARSIVDDKDILTIMRELEELSAKDLTIIRAFHEKFYHGPNMNTKVICPNSKCGEENEIEIPFRLDFLFPDGKILRDTFGEGI